MAGGGIAGRLYRGDVSINFVRKQRLWYTISGLIVLISVIALLTRGLNFSLDFTGGRSATERGRPGAAGRGRTRGGRRRRTSSRRAGSPRAW